MKGDECPSCSSLRFHHDLYRPNCPKCNVSMTDVYKGSLTRVDSEYWACDRCKLELPKYVEQKTPDSKVAITFTSSKSEDTKPPHITGTKRWDYLSPFQKVTRLIEDEALQKVGISSKSNNRPKPVKAFCQTCNKDRSTLGKKCPICHNIIVN